jgi:hypothetical protein
MPPEDWKESAPRRYDGFLETPSYLILKLWRNERVRILRHPAKVRI